MKIIKKIKITTEIFNDENVLISKEVKKHKFEKEESDLKSLEYSDKEIEIDFQKEIDEYFKLP